MTAWLNLIKSVSGVWRLNQMSWFVMILSVDASVAEATAFTFLERWVYIKNECPQYGFGRSTQPSNADDGRELTSEEYLLQPICQPHLRERPVYYTATYISYPLSRSHPTQCYACSLFNTDNLYLYIHMVSDWIQQELEMMNVT